MEYSSKLSARPRDQRRVVSGYQISCAPGVARGPAHPMISAPAGRAGLACRSQMALPGEIRGRPASQARPGFPSAKLDVPANSNYSHPAATRARVTSWSTAVPRLTLTFDYCCDAFGRRKIVRLMGDLVVTAGLGITGADGFFATIRASASLSSTVNRSDDVVSSSFPSGRGFLRFSLGRHRSVPRC